MAEISPKPWRVHRTGSHIGIKDSKGNFIFRKTVNALSIESFQLLSANFDHICESVNQNSQKQLASLSIQEQKS